MKAYKIEPGGSGQPLILDNLGALSDIIGGVEDGEVGNKYTIEVVEMTEDEYRDLPEWGGF